MRQDRELVVDPLNFLAPFGAEVQKSSARRSRCLKTKPLFIFRSACRELGELLKF
jgi:hypothetical protein